MLPQASSTHAITLRLPTIRHGYTWQQTQIPCALGAHAPSTLFLSLGKHSTRNAICHTFATTFNNHITNTRRTCSTQSPCVSSADNSSIVGHTFDRHFARFWGSGSKDVRSSSSSSSSVLSYSYVSSSVSTTSFSTSPSS